LLYVSKAMDLFDLGKEHQKSMTKRRVENQSRFARNEGREAGSDPFCSLTLPDKAYVEQEPTRSMDEAVDGGTATVPADLVAGLANLKNHEVLVMGVASDILFPAWQQKEIADCLRAGGNKTVKHIELGQEVSLFGHDTFLLDLNHIGGNVGEFLA